MATITNGKRTGARRSAAVPLNLRRLAVRRNPTQYPSPSPLGPITLSVTRSMVSASDALRAYLAKQAVTSLGATELHRTGTLLAEHVRKYQAASRQFIKDWLHDVRQTAWLVERSSGRLLDILTPREQLSAKVEDLAQVTVAEDQQLHGLRKRRSRTGLGIPVTLWMRRHGAGETLDPARHTAARAMTAVVRVEQDSDRRVRTVRVELIDPVEVATLQLGDMTLPLAADFTAPVAQTLGLERRPAASAYGIRDNTRRGTVDGFTALTPFAPDREPLILVEGQGLSPLMVAQLANDVAGDADLRRRFQVWLYRYPMVAPLFFAASELRADLESFYTRLEAAAGRPLDGRGVVVAQGPGAVLAKTLLLDSGSTLWDAAFAAPLERMNLQAADRALLESLFVWQRSRRVGRVIVAGEAQNVDALTAGVGTRAVQLLQRQTPELRASVERIYGSQKQFLRGPARSAEDGPLGTRDEFPEPVCQALADAAVAADRALLALVAGSADASDETRLYVPAGGLAPLHAQRPKAAAPGVLGPQAASVLLDWLRPRH